jgi:hypothetical protein
MQTEVEMLTDDEALREAGMTAGPIRKAGFTLQPLSALTLSWLQRNRIFDDDSGDMIQKTAAYAYVHSTPREFVRAVVNDRASFLEAVDSWIEKHIKHHTELEPLSEEMNAAMEAYLAATTSAAHPSDNGIPQPKN